MQILERESALDGLKGALKQAVGGNGRLVLISGEAGIGKTTLVDQFVRGRVQRVLWGVCDELFTPRPLGPLHDVARQAGGELAALTQGALNRSAIFSACLNELQTTTILVFEDIHWADEATLDLLKFLGRRMARTSSLLLTTYRDDELGTQHPLRLLLGDLVRSTAVLRLPLKPLSETAVRRLAGDRSIDAATLHRQTSGNPFFVTEVLASAGQGIPATVRDAVLARAARLSPSGRAVLNAAAVAGQRIEHWLLEEITQAEAAAVEESLALGMLQVQEGFFVFRHELARQTILHEIPPRRRVDLHQLILDALKSSPEGQADLTRVVHHAEAAHDRQSILTFAPAAARQAVAASAHQTANALYALALQFSDALPGPERAALLEAYASECFLTDQHREGLEARRKALAIWQEEGNLLKQGENLAAQMSLLVSVGQNAQAERVSQEAVELLEQLPPSRELALAYRTRATLYLVNRDCREAIEWAERALSLANRFGDTAVQSTAHNVIGTSWLFVDYARGCAYLEQRLANALWAKMESGAATAYTNLGSGSGELFRFAEAVGYLRDGIAYTNDRDLDYHRMYMLAWLAQIHLYQGRWAEADRIVREVLSQPGVSTLSRIVALTVLGRLRARQGEPGAAEIVDEAMALARQTRTIQRLVPVHAARAEAAWLNGDLEATREAARAVYDLAHRKQHPWFTGELAFWRWRAGDTLEIPAWMARPFALQLADDWSGAAAAWEALGCSYEQAQALMDGDSHAQLAALGLFDQLQAHPLAEVVRQKLRAAGISAIPRGPRPTTKENPFQLTNRQLEILSLLTEDLTNAEIAARLHISPKTVDHHVSAVLGKLHVSSREEAADLARHHPDF